MLWFSFYKNCWKIVLFSKTLKYLFSSYMYISYHSCSFFSMISDGVWGLGTLGQARCIVFERLRGGADWLKMKILSRGGEGGALHLKLNFSLSLQFLTCSQKIWGATPSLFTFLYVKRKMFAARKSGGVEAPCPLMLRACWRTLSSSVPLVDCVF